MKNLTHAHAEDLAHIHSLIEAPWEVPWSCQSYAELLSQASVYGRGVFEAHSDSLVSFILYQAQETEVEILYLATLLSHRRQGIARNLLRFLQENYARIVLDVCEENAEALQFYDHLGFVKIAHREKYYKNTFHAFVLEWRR